MDKLRKSLSKATHRKKLMLRIVFDILGILAVSSGIFAIQFGTDPFRRGFFCNDESIQHPVLEDTVSVALASGVGFFLPFITIIVVEFILRHGEILCLVPRKSSSRGQKSWLNSAYSINIAFIFGMAVNQFLTEIGKNSIGRLRPHFLTLCSPDYSKFNCSDGYITADVCTSNDIDMMKEARLSFPSGHSSFVAYTMLFLILYIEGRVCCKNVVVLKPVFQLICFCLAFYTCLSRISDYKHHWSDVLSGAVLGIAVCLCVVFAMTDFSRYLFNRDYSCSEDAENLTVETVRAESVEDPDLQYDANYRPRASKSGVPSVEAPQDPPHLSHVINMSEDL
ncbi:unnamed protein product [Lymnaea stagnalis]|uniref:Phosphatidic acid phosphatase type 2/haloperoxidase domain-containing protein n=1 Tax=Lymnaea stagnalis TaxID=6523 RepID=A0AAV2I4C5_LYMST